MKFKLSILMIMTIIGQLFAVANAPAEEVQKVYEYKNSQGVTEFTDSVEPDKEPVRQLQIEKTTAEEQARSKAKLEQIMEKDKELDKRIEAQRKSERISTRPRSEKQNEEDSNDSYYVPYGRPLPYGARPPHKPVRPVPKPRPLPSR